AAKPFRSVGIELAYISAGLLVNFLLHGQAAVGRHIFKVGEYLGGEQGAALVEPEVSQRLRAERYGSDFLKLPPREPRHTPPELGRFETEIAEDIEGAVDKAADDVVDEGGREHTVRVGMYDERSMRIRERKRAAKRPGEDMTFPRLVENNQFGTGRLRRPCEQDIFGSIRAGVVDRDDAETISADRRAAAVHLLREAAEHRREFGFLVVDRH